MVNVHQTYQQEEDAMATVDEIIFNLKKLKTFEIKALLAQTGHTRIPSQKGLAIQLLMRTIEHNPDEVCKAYDIVVLKMAPKGGDGVPMDAKEYVAEVKSDLSGMFEKMLISSRQEAEEIEEEIRIKLVHIADELSTVLRNNATAALEEAAKKAVPTIIEIKSPGKATKKIKGTMPAEFQRVLKLAQARKNTLLVGPAGCGKTFMAEKVAEALDLQFSAVSCTAGMGESELKGWLLPIGSGGKFSYVSSQFVERYENGGVFLLDEIDAADPNVLVFINQALANGSFFLAHRYDNPQVKRHKDFICIAAANTYGHGADMMYVGRNQLDAATLDRFRSGIVAMDYSDEVEASLIHPEVLAWGRFIRAKIRSHKLRRIMSTRLMKDVTELVELHGIDGWPKEEWDKSYFSDWTTDELRRFMGEK